VVLYRRIRSKNPLNAFKRVQGSGIIKDYILRQPLALTWNKSIGPESTINKNW